MAILIFVRFIITDEPAIIAVGKLVHPSKGNQARIVKIGLDGKKISGVDIGGNGYETALTAFGTDQGKVLVGGSVVMNNSDDGFAMGVYHMQDDMINADLKRYYGPFKGQNGIYSIAQGEDGNLILAGYSMQETGEGDTGYYATIFEVNTEGDLQDSWYFSSHDDTIIYDMIVLPDGAQLIAGKAPDYGKYRPSMFVARREPNTGIAKAEFGERE